MIVLGIDPGYGRCGWGIIEYHGQSQQLVAFGCIETAKEDSHPVRLKQIDEELAQIIQLYKPEKAGVEELFFAKNTTTALKVAEARGIVLLHLAKQQIPLVEITPNQIKQALTGTGAAKKAQIQQMTKILLKLDKMPTPDDAADALAVAITAATWRDFS